nr:O-antigen ligase family protein [uncultured Sphingosinicella sp.]
MAADIVFLAAAGAWAAALLRGGTRFRWSSGYWAVAIYLACAMLSVAASSDPGQSAFKVGTMIYLALLAVLVDNLTDTANDLRNIVYAWLAATAVVALIAVAALVSFPVAPDGPIMRYARFHFGTLPPGSYPRLASTFFNANMLCNYLTVSIGLILVGAHLQWLSKRACAVLLALTGLAALPTISPGLGGIALTVGIWIWLLRRDDAPRLATGAAACGVAAAAMFVLAMAVTPLLHPTAPFLIRIPGIDLVLAPAGRFLTWTAALREFALNPVLGHGIGIEAVEVRYLSPSGVHQKLTDAHNMFLNIAAQAGLVGLAGLMFLIAQVFRGTLPLRFDPTGANVVRLGIGLSFLNAFAYHGLGGSFEDARHLWVLLGMFFAARRLESGVRAAMAGHAGSRRVGDRRP